MKKKARTSCRVSYNSDRSDRRAVEVIQLQSTLLYFVQLCIGSIRHLALAEVSVDIACERFGFLQRFLIVTVEIRVWWQSLSTNVIWYEVDLVVT